MTNDGKENIRHVTCTNHTVRSDKDLFRVCPSKLKRRELEDLYFSLIENNTQLKKTINGQKDQIKVLTTKVNRLTAQKNTLGTQKDCCAGTRAIINEQKESIADLEKANERLSDRIRILNMRLCSAKQFLRRSPAQSMSRCTKCCLTPNASVKNSSMCALNTKGVHSAANLRCDIEAASSEILNKENSTIGTAEVDTSPVEMKDEPCQQNKCRTVMDELKLKIENLEEELSKEHKQHSERMHKLEEEMRALRKENSRVKALYTESEHRLEEGENKAGELLHKLRDTEVQCQNLATELQIEKSKVCELETLVKAADISSQVAEALEKHIKSTMEVLMPKNSEFSRITNGTDKGKTMIQSSDDSGYADKFEDRKDSPKMDHNILAQISSLQAQIDHLKLTMSDGKNKNEYLKKVTVDSFQKSKSDSTENYATAGGDSSLSNDIFTPALREKDIEQIDHFPSIRALDVLMSIEDTNMTSKTNSAKTLSNFDLQNKFQVPVDLPRMPYFRQSSNDTKYFGNSTHDGKDIISDSNSDKLHDIDETRKPSENKVSDSNITEYSVNEKIFNENGYEKKRRRSSLKGSDEDKIKDLPVSYDQKKTTLRSTLNIVDINKNTQVNDIAVETVAPCQDTSDLRVEYKDSERNLKKINNNYKQVNSENTLVNKLSDCRVPNKDHELSKGAENNFNNPLMQEKINKNYNSEELLQNVVKDTKVESSGTSSGNSTYIVECKPAQSKSNNDATYQIENGNKSAAFQVNDGNDSLEMCQSHARTCTCPCAPHRNSSVLRTCSGTLKFKSASSNKNKFKQCHCVRDSETDPCQVGSVGAKSGLAAKQSRMPPPIKTSTPNHKAMVVEASPEVTQSTSPDNTDQEISSLTDLPNEDKSPRDYISPGEERATSTLSDSYTVATTTDYGSLSLGEVPITGAKKLSNLEMKDKTIGSLAMSTTSNKMEEALQAVTEELSRCRELLQGQRPVQVIPGLLANCRAGRFSVD